MINLPNQPWALRLENTILSQISHSEPYQHAADVPVPPKVPSMVDRREGFRRENDVLATYGVARGPRPMTEARLRVLREKP